MSDLARLYTDTEYWRRFLERLKRHGLERADSFWLWKLEPQFAPALHSGG